MIIFDVLTNDSPVGWKGERTRLFLSDTGYEKALDSQAKGQIKILSHAKVRQGNSTTAIAEMLTADKVLIPSAYAALNQPKNCRHKNVADPYRWSATTVGYILDRQEYLGHAPGLC